MNEILIEVNRLLTSVAHCFDYAYVDAEGEKMLAMMRNEDKSELEEWIKKCQEAKAHEVEKQANQLLDNIIYQLTPEEITGGYRIGCVRLKAWLGGLIYYRMRLRMLTDEYQLKAESKEAIELIKSAPESEFQLYAETMIDGVKNDDPISYLFMGALDSYMSADNFKEIVLIALDQRNRRTLDTAIAFAEQLGMKEAIPKIERLTTHPNDRLRDIAIKALETLSRI